MTWHTYLEEGEKNDTGMCKVYSLDEGDKGWQGLLLGISRRHTP